MIVEETVFIDGAKYITIGDMIFNFEIARRKIPLSFPV